MVAVLVSFEPVIVNLFSSALLHLTSKDPSIYSDTGSYPYLSSGFYGKNLPIDSHNYTGDFYVNQGTITAYSEASLDKSGLLLRQDWAVGNINISATNLFSAIRSPSRNDDEAIVQQIFSGNDMFTLSDEDDVIDGYAGDDTFDTGLGNDEIDGGSGTDTVKLSGNYSSYQITHNALENKFTITGSNETKTATNVEQFDFNDVSYSSNELKEKINPIDTYTPPSSANNSGAILLSNEGLILIILIFIVLLAVSKHIRFKSYSTSFSTSNITVVSFTIVLSV